MFFISLRLISIGTSVIIVASFFENIACSLYVVKFSLNFLPLISSILLNTPSTDPYVWISLNAVFSPIPGTPGILSDLSPISPFTSINWVGVTPNSSINAFSLYTAVSLTPFLVITTFVCSDANWRASLSPVTIKLSILFFSDSLETVPIISSASNPSISYILIPIRVNNSFIIGNCSASSGGIFFLPDL